MQCYRKQMKSVTCANKKQYRNSKNLNTKNSSFSGW